MKKSLWLVGLAPVFSPAAGTYQDSVQVTIDSDSVGATIRYTLDGSIPTQNSLLYSAPISISQTTDVKAIAYTSAANASSVSSARYVITTLSERAATPLISPDEMDQVSQVSVTITCATVGATIYYTLDGQNPSTESLVYTDPIIVSANGTVKAIAQADGYALSLVSSQGYAIQVAEPVVLPADNAARTSLNPVEVTIECATPGADIHYTLNGSTPTLLSPQYSVPMQVSETCTLRAIAFKPNCEASGEVSVDFSIGTATAPVFNFETGVYNDVLELVLTTPTDGAIIRYTTDNSDPIETSPAYTGPITIDTTGTIVKAMTFHAVLADSACIAKTYTLKVADPVVVFDDYIYLNSFGMPVLYFSLETPVTSDASYFINVDAIPESGLEYNFSITDNHIFILDSTAHGNNSFSIRARGSKPGFEQSEITIKPLILTEYSGTLDCSLPIDQYYAYGNNADERFSGVCLKNVDSGLIVKSLLYEGTVGNFHFYIKVLASDADCYLYVYSLRNDLGFEAGYYGGTTRPANPNVNTAESLIGITIPIGEPTYQADVSGNLTLDNASIPQGNNSLWMVHAIDSYGLYSHISVGFVNTALAPVTTTTYWVKSFLGAIKLRTTWIDASSGPGSMIEYIGAYNAHNRQEALAFGVTMSVATSTIENVDIIQFAP